MANELPGLSYNDLKDPTNALRYLQRVRTQFTALKYVVNAARFN